MHARVAAFENADMSQIDDLIGTIRDRIRAGEELPGAKGFLMLIDREGGKSLGITIFESEEAIRAAEPIFERMGDEVSEELSGGYILEERVVDRGSPPTPPPRPAS